MNPTRLFIIAVFLTFIFTAFASDKSVLTIEIHTSKSIEVNSNFCLIFATDKRMEGTALLRMEKHDESGVKSFQKSYDLFAGNRKHAIIIYINNKTNTQPDQVFLLPISRKPRAVDWTDWQQPSYVETNADSNFRFDYTPPDRTTNIPPNSFELRYKIE
jgi:hypothetical protein